MNMRYSTSHTSSRVGVDAYMRFEVEPDSINYPYFDDIHHFVDYRELTTPEEVLEKYLWHGLKISMREIANNLDFDDRSDPDNPFDRHCFGELIRVSALGLALDYIDDLNSCPSEWVDFIAELDLYDLQQDFEDSVNHLINSAEFEVMSYLFGKHYEEETGKDDSDVIDDFIITAQEVIWSIIVHLKSVIPNLMDIMEICTFTDGYLTGKWENDHLDLYLMTEGKRPWPERFNRGFKENEIRSRHDSPSRRRR